MSVIPYTLYPIPYTLYPLPQGTNAVGFADSIWWAVGEPGLICRWDGRRWVEMHRAPFYEIPPTPPPSPLLFRFASEEGESRIAFSSAAHGVITVGNQIYTTDDSAVTWSREVLPDTTNISALFLLSDSTSLLGTADGRLYFDSDGTLVRYDSSLISAPGWETQPLQRAHTMLQIGWKDKLDGNLFVLTDSQLYSVRSDLSAATPYTIPLNPGEHAVAAQFPDAYTGYLLTDSIRTQDTLGSNGLDTTLIFDTSKIYRSLDGGSTWDLVLRNVAGLRGLYFTSTKHGYAYGANGTLLHTEDSGLHWFRAWTMGERQTLHAIGFVNDSIGYAVGDSGTALQTVSYGRFWRPVPPEPLFTHPAVSYCAVGFPTPHTVYVVANDRCYSSEVRAPVYWRPHWSWPVRHTLSISESPNPSSGQVEFTIHGNSKDGSVPTLTICDLNGNVMTRISSIETISPNEWHASADLSSLPVNVYAAVVRLGGEQAIAKFLIEH